MPGCRCSSAWGAASRSLGAGELLVHHALRILGEIKDAESNLQALLGAETGQALGGSGQHRQIFHAAACLPSLPRRMPASTIAIHRRQPRSIAAKITGQRHRPRDNGTHAGRNRRPCRAHCPSPLCADRPGRPSALRHARAFRPAGAAQRNFPAARRGFRFAPGRRGRCSRITCLRRPARISLGSNETIKQAVMAGMGISPDLAAHPAARIENWARGLHPRFDWHTDRSAPGMSCI